MSTGLTHPWERDYTINLGSDEEISMWDLAVKIARMMHPPIDVRLKPREEVYGQGYEDCQRRQPDITRARKILGWTPKRSLDDFLPELVSAIAERHLRERRSAELEPSA
jgi:UDP-glucose 4-epimerase